MLDGLPTAPLYAGGARTPGGPAGPGPAGNGRRPRRARHTPRWVQPGQLRVLLRVPAHRLRDFPALAKAGRTMGNEVIRAAASAGRPGVRAPYTKPGDPDAGG